RLPNPGLRRRPSFIPPSSHMRRCAASASAAPVHDLRIGYLRRLCFSRVHDSLNSNDSRSDFLNQLLKVLLEITSHLKMHVGRCVAWLVCVTMAMFGLLQNKISRILTKHQREHPHFNFVMLNTTSGGTLPVGHVE